MDSADKLFDIICIRQMVLHRYVDHYAQGSVLEKYPTTSK